jgi:hypothetical protein
MKTQTLSLLALATTLTVSQAADVSGKVTLKGTPKPEIPIDMSADPKCGALHTSPVTTRHFVVGEGGGLANVIVYVKAGVEKKEFPVPAETPLLDQVGCVYTPYVMGVMAGQKFKVKNSDPTLHNVHATPKAGSANKEFNFAQPVKDMISEKSFAAPEVAVRFKCDVHPWMFAYVGVLDTPYYAVTDKDGNFAIKGLPAGKYTLEAWHPKSHGQNAGVAQEVAVDGDKKVEISIEAK